MPQERRFDHGEAVFRHKVLGVSCKALALEYGVSENGVWQAIKRMTDPVWTERERKRHADWQWRKLRTAECKQCGATIWKAVGSQVRTGLCSECASAARTESVRPTTLRCCECRSWKLDEEFPRSAKTSKKARRGRHAVCRACAARVRRRSRDRHKTPCLRCGKPCLADPRTKGGSGLCRECWMRWEWPKAQRKGGRKKKVAST